MNRRDLIKLAMAGGLGGYLSLLPWRKSQAQATQSYNYKLIQIFLDGGWDSALATDPIIGSKASSQTYASAYSNYEVQTIPQKNNLHIGQGLIPAANAFTSLNTCFINGVFVEVTAHELAKNYIYSGSLSLSRSREFPAMMARIGTQANTFPPFVALGQAVPLGSMRTNPPLHSQVPNQLKDMLNPFENASNEVVNTANELLGGLNTIYNSSLTQKAQENLIAWTNSQARITELYSQNFNLTMDDQLKSDFTVTEEWQNEANFPMALLILSSGLSPFVTLSIPGFDTHTSHFDTHIPLMQGFATRLNTLITKMQQTPDPDDPSKNLSETTLISIMSEFVRTPQINAGGGTDHWQSSSMILMGPGVQDNTVIGATDDAAQAMGWNGAPITKTTETQILPDHVIKTIINRVVPQANTEELGVKSLEGLFQT